MLMSVTTTLMSVRLSNIRIASSASAASMASKPASSAQSTVLARRRDAIRAARMNPHHLVRKIAGVLDARGAAMIVICARDRLVPSASIQ
jgi:hypothetical protein